MAEDIVELNETETLRDENVSISVMDRNVKINDAEMIITDIETANGVIHVIDAVLIP